MSTRVVGGIKGRVVMARRRRFPARMDAFPAVAAFVETACRDAGFSSRDVLRLRLIVEELFTNTVSHGHGGDSDQPVDIALEITAGRIGLTYEDTAPPFDPREPPSRDSVQERPVGQLGLVLVRSMARELAYERVEGRNRVRIALPSAAET